MMSKMQNSVHYPPHLVDDLEHTNTNKRFTKLSGCKTPLMRARFWKVENKEKLVIKKYLPIKYHQYLLNNEIFGRSTGSQYSSWNASSKCIFITYSINRKSTNFDDNPVMFDSIDRFYVKGWKSDVVVSIWIYLD